MIKLLILYVILGLVVSALFGLKIKNTEPDIESDEFIAYVVFCFLLWPLYVIVYILNEYL